MSFFDDIIDVGKTAIGWLGGNSLGGTLARTALTGYALSQITKSINRDNATATSTTAPDPGVRLQVNPDPNHKIPVVYGSAFLGGIITDAQMTNGNLTMYYVVTICEQTGHVDLGSGAASVISFKEIYWNDEKLFFKSDGITVDHSEDRTGAVNSNPDGLIRVYCFNGGSTSKTVPYGYSNASLANAYSIMPGWTTNHTMDDLVFAIVRVDYSKDKNITGIPEMIFHMNNTMTKPGDCIYDYMTNVRYGAGIDPTEIYSS